MAAHLTVLEAENKVTKANLLQTCRCIDGPFPCKELFLGRLPESVEMLENSCMRLSEQSGIKLYQALPGKSTVKRQCCFWDMEQLCGAICSIIDAKLSIAMKAS